MQGWESVCCVVLRIALLGNKEGFQVSWVLLFLLFGFLVPFHVLGAVVSVSLFVGCCLLVHFHVDHVCGRVYDVFLFSCGCFCEAGLSDAALFTLLVLRRPRHE